MQTWSIESYDLKLKTSWKISREESTIKKNFVIRIKDDDLSGMGEVAPSIRFKETPDSIKKGFDRFKLDLPTNLQSLEELMDYLDECEIIGALRYGIESAFVHFLSQLSVKTVPELLGVSGVTSCRSSFSLPIMDESKIGDFMKSFSVERFSHLKIKGSKEMESSYLKEIVKHYEGPLIIDFNEDFDNPDKFLDFCKTIISYNILFIEQPLPAQCFDEYLYLKEKRLIPIFADESITNHQVNEFFSERFDGINVKLMKSGSYIRAIKQLKDASSYGLSTMLGCRIETSLGISSAINLASLSKFHDLDGSLFIENDPFSLLFEEQGRLTVSSLH